MTLDGIIQKKIEELQHKIDYKIKYGYESQVEIDIYRTMDQILDLIISINERDRK